MLVLLVGLFLGMVFFLGGLSGAVTRFRQGTSARRLQRRGTTVQAEVLSRRPVSEKDCSVVAQWEWLQASYTGDFTVSTSWWDEEGGTSIPVRIDPDRPQNAEIGEEWGYPGLTLLLATAFFVMAGVGLFFLVRSVSGACNPVQFDLIEPVCEYVPAVFG